MTKKVSKKNLICLFPPKGGKGKRKARIMKLQRQVSELGELNGHKRPDSSSDWQAHYDYLEASASGVTFASDEMLEEYALRAVALAIKLGDKEKIAMSYKELFRLYSDTNHPDSISIGHKSVEAATEAYGESTVKVADEMVMLALCYEYEKDFGKTIELIDSFVKIKQSAGTEEEVLDALETAIWSASDCGRGDKVEEYARLGLQFVSKCTEIDSSELADDAEYFQQMLETAHTPPVSIDVQRRQLVAMFPGLEKLFPGACQHLP